jgi:hypothetical protein
MPNDRRAPGERRAEPRSPAEGDVTFWLHSSSRSRVAGRLLDLANSGFRAQHCSPCVLAGEEVDFQIATRSGRARVVWTRIVGEIVESGFLIVAKDG